MIEANQLNQINGKSSFVYVKRYHLCVQPTMSHMPQVVDVWKWILLNVRRIGNEEYPEFDQDVTLGGRHYLISADFLNEFKYLYIFYWRF